MADKELIRRMVEDAERARQQQGHAASSIAPHLKLGAVCSITDRAIQFPSERLPGGGRSFHERRRVIILQRTELCQSDQIRTVMVVPCTSSLRGDVQSFDFMIPDGEPGFTKDRVAALASLAQPILKSDIQEVHAVLREATLGKLTATVMWVMALQH